MNRDALDILLAHDAWATSVVLDRCRQLSPADFHRRFEIGPGSLHDTLTHIIGAMRRWADRVGDREVRPSIEKPPLAKQRSADELAELLHGAERDLHAVHRLYRSQRLPEVMTVTFHVEQRELRINCSRLAGLVHVTTHGTHHRAQCLNMLRQLAAGRGEAPNLPKIDVIDWEMSTMSSF